MTTDVTCISVGYMYIHDCIILGSVLGCTEVVTISARSCGTPTRCFKPWPSNVRTLRSYFLLPIGIACFKLFSNHSSSHRHRVFVTWLTSVFTNNYIALHSCTCTDLFVRSVCDSDVLAFAEYLPNLRQLDMLGTNVITDLSIKM